MAYLTLKGINKIYPNGYMQGMLKMMEYLTEGKN